MPRKVSVVLNHDLGKEEARRRVAEGFAKLQSSLAGGMMFSFTEEWTGEDMLTFSAKGVGQRIEGEIDVFPQHVRIEAMLPGVLASLAEIITGKLEKEGSLMLEKK